MHYVYVIRSLKTEKFYIGETADIDGRMLYHNDPEKNTNSTKSGIPWVLFWTLGVDNRVVARKIETHLKRMKSRKYLNDLTTYPEVSRRLVEKYRT